MTVKQPLAPHYGAGKTLTVTTSSATTSFSPGNKQMHIANDGAGIVFVRVYKDANTPTAEKPATTADFPILSKQSQTITIAEDADTIAHIGSAAATAYATPGEGFGTV